MEMLKRLEYSAVPRECVNVSALLWVQLSQKSPAEEALRLGLGSLGK